MKESSYSKLYINSADGSPSLRRFPWRSLLLGLSCVSGLGLIASGAIAYEEFSIPLDNEPLESHNTYIPESEPYYEPPVQESYIAPEPHYEPEPYYEPEPHYEPEPYYEPPVDNYSTDHSITPPEQPIYLPEKQQTAPPPSYNNVAPPAAPTAQGTPSHIPDNSFIDPTDYSIGATGGGYEAPSTVIFSDRSTGCETTVGVGQSVDSLCVPPPTPTDQIPANPTYATGGGKRVNQPYYGQQATGTSQSASYNGNWETSNVANYSNSADYSYQAPVAGVSPVSVGPINMSAMSNSGMSYYNRTMRPAKLPGNSDTHLLFPLSIPAPITSLFGWRKHPILGTGRFHTGIDFGADTGTPVVASYSGEVTLADWLGGYGLTVVLNHQKKSQETLYAHLSELFVKPGESVEQGEVIGRVGSTGMSTGPHLHFELRKLTNEGWVALDPKLEIEFALAQLINTMRVAEVPAEEFIAALPDQTKNWETGLPQLPPLPPGMDIIVPNLEPPTVNFGFKENVEKPQP